MNTTYIKSIWRTIEPLAIIFSILALYYYFGVYGLIGVAGIAIVITGIRIATNWSMYINGIRHIEFMLFGKPLEREYWQKEKPRLPKVHLWKNKKTKK